MTQAAVLKLKRVYEDSARSDGVRFLVERLWPRGMKKEQLKLDAWLKDVAPSDDLRRWFGHDPVKWDTFQRRYRAELDANPDAWVYIVRSSKTRQRDLAVLCSRY